MVRFDDRWVGVEELLRLPLAKYVAHVPVYTAILGPVGRERDNDPDAGLRAFVE